MRLVCPNCDAQYEVSDDAIPAEGRDVQCSNCGHAWFQISPEVEAAAVDEENLFDAPEDLIPERATEPVVLAGAGGEAAALQDDLPAPDAEDADEPEPEAAPGFDAPASLQRRSLDESVMAVLREEAEREVAVRQTEEPRPLETQTDLGLIAPVAAGAARRIAELKGEDSDALSPGPIRPSKGRELLPDIEEINSTLRSSSDRADNAQDMDDLPDLNDRRSGGFRSGFLLMMVLALGIFLAYVMAPKIVEQIPGSADAMASYVAAVDSS
ncbi:MAG: zinc-ribbon domain-containing protein, partial [Paracoccaceae bacterium]|nr:zinc-ribbon domain-containing protein [Paracoccaceae bacterium]